MVGCFYWVAAAHWAVRELQRLLGLGCIDEQACHAALCSGVCNSLATLENKQNTCNSEV